MSASASLIVELEEAIARGDIKRRLTTLTRITDLFAGRANVYSAEQIALFDEVIVRLAADIETQARAELARRLAPVETAPAKIIRHLAHDDAIEVAGPVLAQSARLSEQDLMQAAASKSQAHLLAIAQRGSISEAVTDVLVTRGDQDVVRSVASNEGARFTSESFGKLVERAESDDVLAVRAATRPGIDSHYFHILVIRASDVVLNKLVAASPHLAPQLQKILTEIAGRVEAQAAPPPRNYASALRKIMPLHKAGRLGEREVAEFAGAGKFEETAVALSALCRLPLDVIERAMLEDQGELIFILAKAAGLSWPTTRSVALLSIAGRWSSLNDMEQARYNFERMHMDTAKRVIRFHCARQAGAKETA